MIRLSNNTKIHGLLLFIVLSWSLLFSADKGQIKGFVVDASSGDPLPGANVFLEGTVLGSSTDEEGFFIISNVPAGNFKLKTIYIGYKPLEMEIAIQDEEILTQTIELTPEALSGETIVVTAQAGGQKAAINQQLTAKSIVNVVSSTQIQELPDANAAESLRRMPGISITRDGGEGNKVVVRGMSPKYNAININGVRMSASNPDDRSVDLSMISSTMLEGIEVSKTITADMDADVLGGTVNFKMREAKEGTMKGLGFRILAQGGYTGLDNAINKFRNYKIVPSVEGRFFDQKLGVFFEANIERKNLTSNTSESVYTGLARSTTEYATNSINLHYIPRDRSRSNGALVIDYRLPSGKLSLTNFASSSKTETRDRNEFLAISQNSHQFSLNLYETTLSMINNTLAYSGQIPFGNVDVKLSHNYSETKNPDNWAVSFYQIPGGIGQFTDIPNLDPRKVANAAFHDANNTILSTVSSSNNFSRERSLSASLDIEIPVILSNSINSIFKIGGKYSSLDRSFNSEVYATNATFASPSARGASQMIVDYFDIPTNDPLRIPLTYFRDNNFDYGNFLGGEFNMYNPMDFAKIERLVRFCQANVGSFAAAGANEAYARNNYLSTTNNYGGNEYLSAAYIMATINLGEHLTIIPGVRYQNLQTRYSGVRGQQSPLSYQNYYHPDDTTVTETHPFWLPNLNIRYKPLSWFDVRLAYSNTISYPDYRAIIPRIDVTTGAALAWNNYTLKPSQSRNYDIYFTFAENTVGLLTIGGFYKNITDLIYPWRFSKAGLEAAPYYLPSRNPSRRLTYNISTYVNNPFEVINWGLELEWQTHFWYLPNPLKGLVLNINYTHGQSEAEYPFLYNSATGLESVDSSFTDRLLDQPNHILNMTIGYDFKDFSIRVSWLYQNDVFTEVSQWEQLRANTAAYSRWDISLKQKLPWYGLQIYGNINNLNNAEDRRVLQMYPDIPRTLEHYGMTAELGLRWQM